MDELREYLAASAVERLEMRVRRLVDQIMEPETRRIQERLEGPLVPVMLCVGRRNGKTELMRKNGVHFDQEKREIVDLNEPPPEDEMLHRLRELLESAVTERVHEINWTQELTPTTLRKVTQAMRPLRVMPLEQDPLKRLFLRMAMSDQQMLGHDTFVTVTEPLELSDEIKVELPAETMRKYLDALGVKGDS